MSTDDTNATRRGSESNDLLGATAEAHKLTDRQIADMAFAVLRRGVDGVCTRSTCECAREGLGDQCIWLRPSDAELERRTGEPHIDGWPLYSGLPPAA